MVEALKSICGVSWLSDYNAMSELNLRKHQQKHVHGNSIEGNAEDGSNSAEA